MADSPAIRIAGVSKRYQLGAWQREQTFGDLLTGWLRRDRAGGAAPDREFWALLDISLDVARGQVMGIVGRNGAGKSTLLKILSRVTEPTAGRVELRGRVTSLLEVGTGFHPELTGRENVFLNGAILGMSRRDIARKFDEIVAFAEVEAFVDTPVKRYSSGMYLRLAFSISAHLEPEIQIVDEVLAVGDAAFQKKCVAKIQSLSSRDGATVLFVSHSVATVQELCTHAAWLDKGSLVAAGAANEVVEKYYKSLSEGDLSEQEQELWLRANFGEMHVGVSAGAVTGGDAVLTVRLRAARPTELREMALLIYSEYGARAAIVDLRPALRQPVRIDRETLELSITLRHLPLVEGTYPVGLYLASDWLTRNFFGLAPLVVGPRAQGQSGALEPYPAVHRGVVVLEHEVARR